MATSDLFVYGTLTVDQVIATLIDRIPSHKLAIAQGWLAVQLPGRLYPGLVPDIGHAPGRLYTDLTTREWATLDAFEDPTYTLTAIKVLPGPRPALTYTWPARHLPNRWSLDELSATDLANYLERCKAWRQRYEQRREKG